MTRQVAFLRGVNLGRRTVRSADLKAAFIGLGFADAEPLLASGNVVFTAPDDKGLAARIEAGLAKTFGFAIGTVLRSHAELAAMIAADPFAAVPAEADAKLYVAMLAEPIARTLPGPHGVPGDFDVLSIGERDIFAVAWKQPDGRYGSGLDTLGKGLPRDTLITMRNWNTILKAAAKSGKEHT